MKKPAYLVLSALVIIVVVIAAIAGRGGGAQNSQSASHQPAQRPLTIDNSTTPSLQTQGSGLNPQPASTSTLPETTGPNIQDDSNTNPLPAPCNSCRPGPGRMCPDFACPYTTE